MVKTRSRNIKEVAEAEPVIVISPESVADAQPKEDEPKEDQSKNVVMEKPDVPRGVPKSGKFWKTPKEKFRKIQNSLPKKTTQQHLKLRDDLRRVREMSRSLKEEKKQENILKAQRREQNAQRRAENERKNETVQVIKNTAKLKRTKKKHLKQIQKRDLSNLGKVV